MILAGTLLTAIGVSAFLAPHHFISPGISGLSLLLSYITSLPAGLYVIVLNIPIFLVGWRYVGRTFAMGSVTGTVVLSVFLMQTDWMIMMGWAPEPMMSAMVGGVLSGAGTGLLFRANSSHGGTDIIAAVVKRKWSYSIGSVVFFFNGIFVLLLAYYFGLDAALYSILAQFCSAMALDKVMLGFDHSRAVFIVTTKPKEISGYITGTLGRGVTMIDGTGAYSGKEKTVLFCVISLRQLARVKIVVESQDKKAFMTVAQVSEVIGRGFTTLPV